MLKPYFILITCLFAFNCNAQNLEEKLIGTWGLSGYDNAVGAWTFEKVRVTKKHIRSYRFETDGKVFVRADGIGCGVPKKPLLTEFPGNWKTLNDSVIRVTYDAALMGPNVENVYVNGDVMTIQLAEN